MINRETSESTGCEVLMSSATAGADADPDSLRPVIRDLQVDRIRPEEGLGRKRDRTGHDELCQSIREFGVLTPVTVRCAPDGSGDYLLVKGQGRTLASAYVVNHDRRHEIRYQTDIYQDLLPSQLAALVEHLHQNDHIQKSRIAAYIGVSAPTLRNYTGLWRLIQRSGLFARVVELMDAGVVPASNPYAWLRLTPSGLRSAIEMHLANGDSAGTWIDRALADAAAGRPPRLSLKTVEAITGGLPPDCYREDEEVRLRKRDLGLRRGKQQLSFSDSVDTTALAMRNLRSVAEFSENPVLRVAAQSLQAILS